MRISTKWSFTFAVFLCLFWPFLGQKGMFLDGVTYGTISRNIAFGLGSFSAPHYTDTLFSVFYEQPPLALWLESWLFRLCGDHFWVERLFPFLMAICNGWMIVLLWRSACQKAQDENRLRFSWLPLLFWITSPIVFWCFQQNMLEAVMSFFVLLSAWFALRAAAEEKAAYWIISGLLISAGALSKGPVAFFPASTPLMFAVFWEKRQVIRGLAFSGLSILIALAGIALCVKLIPGMSDYLDYYLHRQLFPTLAGTREKQVTFPFAFFPHLLEQLVIPLLIALWAIFRKKQSPERATIFFLALGLCGVLPLALSPKQSGHYLVPAIPFFALGLAWIASGALATLHFWEKLERPPYKLVAQTLLALVLLSPIWTWGKFSRDSNLLSDIGKITQVVPAGSTVSVPGEWAENWLLHAYFARMGNISLDSKGDQAFAVTQKNATFRPGFEKSILVLNTLELYQKNPGRLPEH